MDINVNVSIDIPGLSGFLNNLASAMVGEGIKSEGVVEKSASPTRKSRLAKVAEVVAVTEPETAKVADSALVIESTAEVVQAEEVLKAAPTYTLEQVRAKLSALSAAGFQPQIKELFGKFYAKKLTEVPTEKFAELMVAAEEIG